jgi:radical S-adenosyl methionine domain-containing protein 2
VTHAECLHLGPQVGELVAFAKQVLGLESVSIVSNGSLIRKSWLQRYGAHLDILAISCDSFDEATNVEIGRGSGDNVEQLFRIRAWCREYGIKFKLNTVVCRYNHNEDMARRVEELEPFRWKCFQVLRVEGENDSEQTLRDVRRFEIDDDEFGLFCKRHEHLGCFVPESNKAMAESYLILDEVSRGIHKFAWLV